MRNAINTACAAVLLATMPVMASDREGQYAAQGAISCGNYLSPEYRDRDGMPYIGSYGWMAGYITAFNYVASDTYHLIGNTDMRSIALWMDNYCKANPLSDIAAGMEKLIVELYPKRVRTRKEAR